MATSYDIAVNSKWYPSQTPVVWPAAPHYTVPSLESLALLALYNHDDASLLATDPRAAGWRERLFCCKTCRRYHLGTQEHNADIELVAREARASCEQARRALHVHADDLVNAIFSLLIDSCYGAQA